MQTIGSKSCILIGHGLKSGADQSMLTRELQLYKARFGAKNVILSLVLERITPCCPLLKLIEDANKETKGGEEEMEETEAFTEWLTPRKNDCMHVH